MVGQTFRLPPQVRAHIGVARVELRGGVQFLRE
jgi:hypothetical protein